MKIKEVAHTPSGTALILEDGTQVPWEDIATNNSVFAGDYVVEEKGAARPFYHCPKAVFEARYEVDTESKTLDAGNKAPAKTTKPKAATNKGGEDESKKEAK